MPIIHAIAQSKRHHCPIQQASNPAQRPHPGKPRCPAPAHGFRPGKPAQHRRHRLRDQRGSGHRGHRLLQHPKIAFLPQFLAHGAMLAQKPRQSLLRRIRPWSAFGCFGFRRPCRHLRHQRQPARPIKNFCPFRRQRRQRLAQHPGQIFRRPRLHPRRNFLTEKFQKKLSHSQSFSAGSISVWGKSLPLNSSFAPVSLAVA